ncbi:MAG: hypothetical protein ACJ8GW_11660 [Massilia sp.]
MMNATNFALVLTALVALSLLGAAHARFTPKAAELIPLAMFALGGCALTGIGSSALAPGVAILAFLGALSLKARATYWGIDARYLPPAGPSITDVMAQLAHLHGESAASLRLQATAHANQLALLRQDMHVHSDVHAEALAEVQTATAAMRDALAAFTLAQQRQQYDALMAALSQVISNFNDRINSQFVARVAELKDVVANNVQLQDRHRAQQGEMMHHARRNADQMSQTTDAFRTLLADSAALAGIGEQVRAALATVGPRQDSIADDVTQLATQLQAADAVLRQLQEENAAILDELQSRTRKTLDGLGQRMGQQATDIGQTVQRSAEQTRSQAADAATKSAQQISAMSKELNEALNKAMTVLTKQLSATSTRLSSDLGPMAQQIRRVAEQSKVAR